MAETNVPSPPRSVSDGAARQLANATKTVPQLSAITPRWLVHMLQWVPVEAGIYRLNRVREEAQIEVSCGERDERLGDRWIGSSADESNAGKSALHTAATLA